MAEASGPQAAATSSSPNPPAAALSAPPVPQAELIPAVLPEGEDIEDNDSALGEDDVSSTASVSSDILNYRTIQGRTFHSERQDTEYFTPNDDKQSESVDITHHYLTLLLGGKLCLAPIKDDVKKVLDVGTGTGIWAIDFADEFPNAEVIGTDLSPIQPSWVPPNLKFELEDATAPWSFPDGTFDFVHVRYLFGAIADWDALYSEAYRACTPGGWVESCECDPVICSDDGTTDANTGIESWNALYVEGGKKFGRSFCVVAEGLQTKGMKAAGFVDVQEVNYKIPIGGWPQEPKISEVGQYTKLTIENDIEGYTLLMWHNIMGWPKEEYQVFLMSMRKVLKNKQIHGYFNLRYVYGRKPEKS
ncbi:Phosphoethanolamine N-methyltransferase 3-like protein 1 [Pleurostoma richardsiae]|uniref:Phosphoethanolamine N-methyltransferase 3-like protein 1 n=1 Tax=Pleurostoma richardsiae TaxID=41990 RepID=A0AA38VL45_9PEZI|nr:Phosphoethanolamine N-methyltransferase 3-like protein 1 [Pleurostoma richardsiae]